MNKPKSKKVKKYRYSRKEIADKWETTIKYSGNDLIRKLLATQPQPIKEECKHELGDIEEHDNLGTYHTAGDTCIKCGKHILDFDNPKQQSKDIEMKNDATKGVIDNAVRRALNLFDKWNDVTGLVGKHTGYYYELQGLMEDAVHCGIQELTGDYKKLDGEE